MFVLFLRGSITHVLFNYIQPSNAKRQLYANNKELSWTHNSKHCRKWDAVVRQGPTQCAGILCTTMCQSDTKGDQMFSQNTECRIKVSPSLGYYFVLNNLAMFIHSLP